MRAAILKQQIPAPMGAVYIFKGDLTWQIVKAVEKESATA
jgi:hypothetical protein